MEQVTTQVMIHRYIDIYCIIVTGFAKTATQREKSVGSRPQYQVPNIFGTITISTMIPLRTYLYTKFETIKTFYHSMLKLYIAI